MENNNIYKDIATRTNGDIYMGVVGPVRTGKSTFITKFVTDFILPNIPDGFAKERTIDELPQSSNGKTIMTTQPKFVPNEAIKVKIEDVSMNVRLVDCVGYVVDGVMGIEENSKSRLIKTPWQEKEMPFSQAAEFGTKKVITDHSTFNVMITTDGTITEIPRIAYERAEEKIIKVLKENNKPFVILLNSQTPDNEDTKNLAKNLEKKYKKKVICLNLLNLTEKDIGDIMTGVLEDFPIESIQVKMPNWMKALEFESPLITEIVNEILSATGDVTRIGEFKLTKPLFEDSENFETTTSTEIIMSEGKILITVEPKPELFYKVLSQKCQVEIKNEFALINYITELTFAKREYDKLKIALDDVEENGYGVVFPSVEDMKLEEPQIVKQGNKFGVQLKASAPSLHIMKVDLNTEINPIVGTQQQSEDLVKYLLSEFENNPNNIWETNMFGKSLSNLVNEGINGKILAMPQDTQKKLRKTLSRIVNEGKGGIICILL